MIVHEIPFIYKYCSTPTITNLPIGGSYVVHNLMMSQANKYL